MIINVGDTFKNSNNTDCIIIDNFNNGFYNYFDFRTKEIKGVLLKNIYDDRFMVASTFKSSRIIITERFISSEILRKKFLKKYY
jgi:hypothetical protein